MAVPLRVAGYGSGLSGDLEALQERISAVNRLGVPSFFGVQRFGNRDANLYAARALFTGETKRVQRHLRGLWLSAARSQLFNQVLTLRVERSTWDRPLAGDRMQLAGSRASFLAEEIDQELNVRRGEWSGHTLGPTRVCPKDTGVVHGLLGTFRSRG